MRYRVSSGGSSKESTVDIIGNSPLFSLSLLYMYGRYNRWGLPGSTSRTIHKREKLERKRGFNQNWDEREWYYDGDVGESLQQHTTVEKEHTSGSIKCCIILGQLLFDFRYYPRGHSYIYTSPDVWIASGNGNERKWEKQKEYNPACLVFFPFLLQDLLVSA